VLAFAHAMEVAHAMTEHHKGLDHVVWFVFAHVMWGHVFRYFIVLMLLYVFLYNFMFMWANPGAHAHLMAHVRGHSPNQHN
jgi:hypothetical protein